MGSRFLLQRGLPDRCPLALLGVDGPLEDLDGRGLIDHAALVLGPAARQASKGQLSAYTKVFQGYISRKYGRRFREFIGGRIEVADARAVKSYYEVISTAYLKGESPFEVRWHVSDKSGKSLFFNIIIEGVNMLASERTEMGALLDQRGGDLDRLIEDLKLI